MPEPTRPLCLTLACLAIFSMSSPSYAQRPEYPPSRTVATVDEIHGVQVSDPYRWLEEGASDEVQRWTDAQNALTDRLLGRFETQRNALRKRLEALHRSHVASTPRNFGDRYFYTKRTALQNHPTLYVRIGGLDTEPQVVLDPNNFSDDGSVALDWWHPSPNGKLVAYGKSAGGTENSTLYVRNVDTGEDLPVKISRTRHAAVAWDADSGGFLYTRYPAPDADAAANETLYHRHVYYHKLGTDPVLDPKIWGNGRPKEEWVDVYNSDDNRYQFLATSLDWARNDLYMRPMGQDDFTPLATGLDGQFQAEVLGDRLYLRTNFEAPRYRIVACPVDSPAQDNWQDIIPQQKGVIEDFELADEKLVITVMENAYSRVLIHEPAGELVKEVTLPTLGSVSELTGSPGTFDLLFSFQSFAYPPVVFHYDLGSHTMNPFDRMEVAVELANYETRQIWFNSKDGTRVPMFVTHRKGLELNGNNPAVLWGYGGFAGSQTPFFYRGCIPWLDRGGIWAVANIRGGGEFGKEWHLAGRLERKQNTFDDFIAAAEKLIADGYTRAERLGARGGSNGGLLVGAALVQRPDLFGAISCEVPLLDMIRYHRFSIARLWIPEYGSAEDPEQFETLLAYSPYHHVEQGVSYPAVLLMTAEGDTRVDPMHARKMAAALQNATASDQPVLLKVERKAGHGAGKPLKMYVDKQLDVWTFFMWQLGVFAPPSADPPATQPAGSPQ